MTKVISILSKKKEQMIEYKKLKNQKYDEQIKKSETRTADLKAKKAKFNEEIDARIEKLKD